MNILIDTNIFIPLEPVNSSQIEANTHLINEFYRKSKQLGYHVFLLDTQKNDIESDKNNERRRTRLLAFEKYEALENIKTTDTILQNFSEIQVNSHDYIDISLLNAVCANAVSFLVTDDEGIHRKAKKINKQDVVYHLADALDFINSQLPHNLKVETKHPIIKPEKCFNLDIKDTFFDTLRNDYSGFDNWFIKKCQNGHRDCLVIRNGNKIGGLCIYKFEQAVYGMTGNILKICTFKLSISGNKQGELLLKYLFNYCYSSNVDWIYVTAFEKNYICQFFESFGFEKYSENKKDTGEFIFRKKMKPDLNSKNIKKPLEYDIKYGPRYIDFSQNAFLVPIISNYHDMLFPETIKGNSLFPEIDYYHSFSNAIRKAYICNSNTSLLNPGSILFFYKSHGTGTIQTCGIVERIEREKSPDNIISIAGKRTVYQRKEIEEMCKKNKNILVLLFMQIENLKKEVKLNCLKQQNLIKSVPMSITKISEEAKNWLLSQK